MRKTILFLLIWFCACAYRSQAQNITISGNGINTVTFTRAMFTELKHAVLMAKAHDEKVHRYTGVALYDILMKAGVAMGDSSKKNTINTYIIITAADNYKAIYALPEIDPLFANRIILLADKVDKKPLPESYGPYQIIVPGEKKHARWMRQVTSIQVVKVK